jgi:hypothetical protein
MIAESRRRHYERSSSSLGIPSNYSWRYSFFLRRRSSFWWKRPSHDAQLVRSWPLEPSAESPARLWGVLDAVLLAADQWSAGRAWDMAVSSHIGLLGRAFWTVKVEVELDATFLGAPSVFCSFQFLLQPSPATLFLLSIQLALL